MPFLKAYFSKSILEIVLIFDSWFILSLLRRDHWRLKNGVNNQFLLYFYLFCIIFYSSFICFICDILEMIDSFYPITMFLSLFAFFIYLISNYKWYIKYLLNISWHSFCWFNLSYLKNYIFRFIMYFLNNDFVK